MTFKIVKNETAATVAPIGTVAFEPLERAAEWQRRNGRTHSQRFAFTANGREYWGEIVRTFDRDLADRGGKRVSYDVGLMTRDARTGHGRHLPESAKRDWRDALVSRFKHNLELFLADAERDAPEAPDAVAAEPVRLCVNCRVPADAAPLCDDCAAVDSIRAEFMPDEAPRLETGETGPDWEPTDATRYYAQRGDGPFAFGPTVTDAVIALERLEAEKAAALAPDGTRRDNVEWHKGQKAHADGLPLSANPYPSRDVADSRSRRWALGWSEAFQAAVDSFNAAGAEPDPAGASLPDLSDYAPPADPVDSISDAETVREVGTVDLTPTWGSIAGLLILALENGTETGKAAAREEIRRACALADERNALAARVAQLEPLEAVATEANETAHCVPGMAGEALRGALRAAGWDCPEPDAPAAEVAAVAAVSTPVPWQRVADVICNGVEMGGSYIGWLHGFYKAAGGEGMQNAYAEGAFWQAGGVYRAHFDLPDGDEGEGAGRFLVAAEDITAGLETMARVCPSHFADLVAENDDICTADALLQCVILRADVEAAAGLIYG
jgi:hypothetical protein